MYTDSHCHITCDELYSDLEGVLSRMKDVSRVMIVCTSEEEYLRAIPIRSSDPVRFRIAFGFYPGDADEVTEERLAFLEEALKSGNVDVLGEIGLDHHWPEPDRQTQKDLFVRQIRMANDYDLPIAIHMRDASQDTLDLLRQEARTPIVFHCFSGSPETMREALKLNSLISFAGPVTFKNARHAPACVQACPADRILTETDAPYMAPVPMRGRRNEPAYVAYTTKKICELKNLPEKDLTSQIGHNFDSLFSRQS